jgi:hypothetical protein
MTDEQKQPLLVRCGTCNHVWAAAWLPMPLGDAGRLLKRIACPMCAAPSRDIYLYDPKHGEVPKGS